MFCSRVPKYTRFLRLKTTTNTGGLAKSYDTVILGYEKYPLIHDLLSSTQYSKLLVTPFSRITSIPVKCGDRARVIYECKIEGVDPDITDYLEKEIRRYLKIVRVKDLEEILGLLPPKGLGVIVDLAS